MERRSVGGRNGRVGWYNRGWRAEQQGEVRRVVREQGEFSRCGLCKSCKNSGTGVGGKQRGGDFLIGRLDGESRGEESKTGFAVCCGEEERG